MSAASVRSLLHLCLLLCFAVACRSKATTTQRECLALKTKVERLVLKELKSNGDVDVQRGSFEFGFVGDEAVLDCEKNNCAFTNPKSPYGLAVLPLAKEESFQAKYTDPRTSAYALESFEAGGGDGRSRVWQLRFDEVVIAIGCTPPAESSRYFAITGYLFELYDSIQKSWVSPFGSLQDSIGVYRDVEDLYGIENRLVTTAEKSDTTTDRQRSSAFNKLTIVLMGASKKATRRVQARIKEALLPLGIEHLVKNVIVISKPFAEDIGLDRHSNYYSLIVRNIVPDGAQEAFKAYASGEPLCAMRVTPKRSSKKRLDDIYDFPRPVSRKMMATDDGSGFEAPFAEGLEMLIDRIGKEYTKKHVVAHAIGSGSSLGLLNVDAGIDCVDRRIEICNGNNRDAQYLSTYPLMLLDDKDKFAYVVGVNHRVAGLVAYSNIAVSDMQAKLGVRSIDDQEMIGSAERWLKGTPFENMASYYYALRFSRHCDGAAFCTEIPSEGPRAVPYDREILVNSRLYVNGETGVGPDDVDVVMPHMMIFTPQGKHTERDMRSRIDPEILNASPCMASFLSLTLCTGGISADCCNGVVSWTEMNCFCDAVGKVLVETLPPETGERGLRVLSMICGKPAPDYC